MGLTTEQQMLVEQQVANEQKSMVLAYVAWFFLGALGVHRFYLGRHGSGLVVLGLSVVGWMFLLAGGDGGGIGAIGLLMLAAVGIWMLADLFMIPGMVDRHRAGLRAQFAARLQPPGGAPEEYRWAPKA